jgi:3-dehydroquinate dehydratase
MKQTAVEWLAWEIGGLDTGMSYHHFTKKVEQAKEMEKEQKMNDFIAGMEFIAVDPNRYKEDAEQYYNETYGGAE